MYGRIEGGLARIIANRANRKNKQRKKTLFFIREELPGNIIFSGIAGAFDWIYGYDFCSWDNIFS